MVFESLFDHLKTKDDIKVIPVTTTTATTTTDNNNIHRATRADPKYNTHASITQEKEEKKQRKPPKQGMNSNGVMNQRHHHHHHHSSKPSPEAMQLSSKLKEYSTQKRLKECLELFWSKENDHIRDGHHACIVVDCCARCGDIQTGEDIVQQMQKEGQKINVQTHTSLLKGYCHSGLLHKASDLYYRMTQSKDIKDRPNVRTLNTLLRGCMWTAAQLEQGRVEGGTVTSEKIWHNTHTQLPDVSSYEYSVALLTQSLQCDIAERRIEQFCQRFEVTNQTLKGKHERYHAKQDPFSTLETLAVSYLNLSKAHSLLQNKALSKRFAERTLDVISSARVVQIHTQHCKTTSIGGKRAFRSEHSGGRREESNVIFRSHKLGEIENDANVILSYIQKGGSSTNVSLASTLVRKIVATDGGGTTDLQAIHGSSKVDKKSFHQSEEVCKLLNALWISFGLSAAIQKEFPKEKFPGNLQMLSKQDCERILQLLHMEPSYILNENGSIDFHKVFEESNYEAGCIRPLCIELGSGFGEWAAFQAKSNPTNNYVAVEMRSDRVGQTFCKAFLSDSESPLQNLCCVGAECGSFLRNRVKEGCVSKIFVNHPEPPTQTYGTNAHILNDIATGGDEPAHMLASETLISAARCLDKNNGEMIIVTDNRWYANLICSTVLKVMKLHKGLIYSKNIQGLKYLHVFRGPDGEEVVLYEGQPGPIIGHAVHQSHSGSTYFDRLWRKGGGSHADKKSRFIICLQRSIDTNRTSYERLNQQKASSTTTHRSGAQKKKTSKSNKRSAAKQQLRNERRLLKKAKLQS